MSRVQAFRAYSEAFLRSIEKCAPAVARAHLFRENMENPHGERKLSMRKQNRALAHVKPSCLITTVVSLKREANFGGMSRVRGPDCKKGGKRGSQDALKESKVAPRREKDSCKDVFKTIFL